MRRGIPFLALLLLLSALSAVRADDQIRFKNGRSITGKIISEDAKSVTIEIEGGGRLTVPRSDVAEILRDVNEEGKKAAKTGVLRAEFFFVWNGTRRVGTRSLYVRKLSEGGLQLEEETTFFDKKGKPDVRTRIVETVSDSFAPKTIQYREIAIGGETLLEGTVRDGNLDLTVTGPKGRQQTRLSLPDGVRFPLSAREFAVRERSRLKGAWEAKVFDPREQNFFLYRFENGGTRRVNLKGAVTEVTVLYRKRGGLPREEIWLGPGGRTLTEELNGPALVAVATTRERFDAVRNGGEVAPSEEEERVKPLYVNSDAGFSIRKPNLSWTFEPGRHGSPKLLTIENLRWFADVDVLSTEGTPEGRLLASLAVDMGKKFSAASKDFKKLSQGYLDVGGEKAVRLEVSSKNRGEEIHSWLVGFLHGGRTWILTFACPKAYFEKAKPDFSSMLSSFCFTKMK